MKKRIIILFSLCLFLLSIIFVQNTYAVSYAYPINGNQVEIINPNGNTVTKSGGNSWNDFIVSVPNTSATSFLQGLRIKTYSNYNVKKGQHFTVSYLVSYRPGTYSLFLNNFDSVFGAFCQSGISIQQLEFNSCDVQPYTNNLHSSVENVSGATSNYVKYQQRYYISVDFVAMSDFSGNTFDLTGTTFYVSNYSSDFSYTLNLIYDAVQIHDTYDPSEESNLQHAQELEQQQEAVDSVANNSNVAQQEVTSGTTNLLGAITKFIGSITSATATNCVITLSYGSYFSQPVDLCSINPPPILTTLLSIPVALFVFKLSKNVLMKIINLFRSFQG